MADDAPPQARALPPRLDELPLFTPSTDPRAQPAAPDGGWGPVPAPSTDPAAVPGRVPGLVEGPREGGDHDGSPSAPMPARAQAAVRSRRAARAAGTGPVPFGATSYDARAVDWGLVRTFRQRASQKLAEQLRTRPGVDDEDRRELGRSIIRSLLEDHARADALDGSRLMDLDDEQALAAAIFDSLFGLGRLQPLVDLPDVENIEITGHDAVLMLYADGRRESGPPVADSDEELIEFLPWCS